jgi:uncharacterized metal-binding protein YceD (DUF177 family)
MTRPDVPFSAAFDLSALPERGAEIVLEPTPSERDAISAWLGTEAVESLKASIALSREGDDEYGYSAHFDADVVQACVVTLEPVRSHLSGEFRRHFRILPRVPASRRGKQVESSTGIDISALDEEECELIESPVIDLAAPLLEEVSLALNPYPRAPGAAFEPAKEEVSPSESPFAVLEKLKARSDKPGKAKKAVKPAPPGKKRG